MLSPGPTAIFILLLISFFSLHPLQVVVPVIVEVPTQAVHVLNLRHFDDCTNGVAQGEVYVDFPGQPPDPRLSAVDLVADLGVGVTLFLPFFFVGIQHFQVLDLNELVVRRVGSSSLLHDLLPVEESLLPFLEEDEAVVAQGAPGDRQADCPTPPRTRTAPKTLLARVDL